MPEAGSRPKPAAQIAAEVAVGVAIRAPLQVLTNFTSRVASASALPTTTQVTFRTVHQVPAGIARRLTTATAAGTNLGIAVLVALHVAVRITPRTVPGTVPGAIPEAATYATLDTPKTISDNYLVKSMLTQAREERRSRSPDVSCARKDSGQYLRGLAIRLGLPPSLTATLFRRTSRRLALQSGGLAAPAITEWIPAPAGRCPDRLDNPTRESIMSAMGPGVPACVLLVIMMLGTSMGQDRPSWLDPVEGTSRLSLLVRGSLARARVGYADAELDFLRAGIGVGFGGFGIIASTGAGHVAPSGWAGDYTIDVANWLVECDLTYGLAPGSHLGHPVLYVHGEYALDNSPGVDIFSQRGGSIGVGTLWTYWAISGGVQVTWRRSVSANAAPWDRYRDFYSIGVVVDLGGWWAIGLGPRGFDSGDW
jgi:hypothetical protein